MKIKRVELAETIGRGVVRESVVEI
jgi:hypothetical protein